MKTDGNFVGRNEGEGGEVGPDLYRRVWSRWEFPFHSPPPQAPGRRRHSGTIFVFKSPGGWVWITELETPKPS